MSLGAVLGISSGSLAQQGFPLGRSPLDQKIRKHVADALVYDRGSHKRARVEFHPIDVWLSLEKENDIQRLGFQFRTVVCDQLLNSFRHINCYPLHRGFQTSLEVISEQIVEDSEGLMIESAIAYDKVTLLPDDSLIDLITLDATLFDDPVADQLAYSIGHRRNTSNCIDVETSIHELSRFLSLESINRAVDMVGFLIEYSRRAEVKLKRLKQNLQICFSDCETHVRFARILSEIKYEALNSKLTAFIALISRRPELLRKYFPYVQMIIPTKYHFIEALYAHADFELCTLLQGRPHTEGFQDTDLIWALKVHSPLEIVTLIPVNMNLIFHYLEDAIKLRAVPDVISYLLDKTLQQKSDKADRYAEAFRAGLEHNLDVTIIRRFIIEGGIRPTRNDIYAALICKPSKEVVGLLLDIVDRKSLDHGLLARADEGQVSREIYHLLIEALMPMHKDQVLYYLKRAIQHKLNPGLISFFLEIAIQKDPKNESTFRGEELQVKYRDRIYTDDMSKAFQEGLKHDLPIEFIQKFIEKCKVKPTREHIEIVLANEPSQEVIVLLLKHMDPKSVDKELLKRAQEKKVSSEIIRLIEDKIQD